MASAVRRLGYFLFSSSLAIWPRAESAVSMAWRAPLFILAASKSWAKVFLSKEDVLKKAFPESSEIQRKTLFLSDEQIHAIESASRVKVGSRVITYYEGRLEGSLSGAVFFDTQIVRTMPMTFMTFIKPDGTLGYVEVLSFHEPPDYLPRPGWLRLFAGKPLDEKLRLRWGIPNVTGASLTCQALTDGVRRLLATHHVAVRKEASR